MSNQIKLHDDAEELSLPEARLTRLKALRDKCEQKDKWAGRGTPKPARTLIVVNGDEAAQLASYLKAKSFDSKVTFEIEGHKVIPHFDGAIRDLEREIADAEKANQPDPMLAVKEMQASMAQQQQQFMQMMATMLGAQAPAPETAPETAPEETPAES